MNLGKRWMNLKKARAMSKSGDAFRVDKSGFICLVRKRWQKMIILAEKKGERYGWIRAGELKNNAIADLWDDWVPLKNLTPGHIPNVQRYDWYEATYKACVEEIKKNGRIL